MYDLIGDIHGHADELVSLLEKLGYTKRQGVYRRPDRKVIFLGDFIDRGPKIREVLETVKPMVEEDAALAVMGNHELNAIAYQTEDLCNPGERLRRNTPKNNKQHAQTLSQLDDVELRSYLDWFRQLPLFLDLDGLRAVHACWDRDAAQQASAGLIEHGGVTDDFMRSACREGEPLFDPIETLLKGKESPLPNGLSFADKDGHVRTKTRVRWYLSPEGHTYRTYAMTNQVDCDFKLETDVYSDAAPYPPDDKPVFVGHYWLSARRPELLAVNVACLDYSVAKDGFLCAYRWDGEHKLTNDNFVWVGRSE